MKVTFFATGFARVPKGLFVKEAPWRSVKVEPGIEMVGCHDHRIPGRYDLAPVGYS